MIWSGPDTYTSGLTVRPLMPVRRGLSIRCARPNHEETALRLASPPHGKYDVSGGVPCARCRFAV